MSERNENLIALAGAALLAVALVTGLLWHASIVDRAAARHFACVAEEKADGLTTRQAHDACVAQGIGHR